MTSPTVAILAGGQSRRMGRDKALIEFGGVPILARLVAASRDAGLDVIVVGRDAVRDIGGVERWIADDAPGAGPLAALATALRSLDRELLLLACDMPLVDAGAIRWLADSSMPPTAEILAVSRGGRIEPLFARYPAVLLPEVERLLQDGERSLRGLIASAGASIVEAPPWLLERLADANTPEELVALERSMPGFGRGLK